MEAIILAGGLGERLKSLGINAPKPMLPVGSTPFLKYLLTFLIRNGIGKMVLSVGYQHEKIINYFGNSFMGHPIVYSIEEEPLGTGGAVRKGLEYCSDEYVWVVNGDTFFEIDIMRMKETSFLQNCPFSMAIKPMENFSRYGRVLITNENMIVKFEEKKEFKKGYINGGIYLLNSTYFLGKDLPDIFSMENDFLEVFVEQDDFLAFISDAYFIDIGVPEDYLKAQIDKSVFEKYE